MLSFSPDIRFCRNGHPMHAKRPLGDRIGRIGQVASPSSTSHVQFTRNRHTEHVSDTPDVRFTRNRQAQDKKCVLGDRFSRIGQVASPSSTSHVQFTRNRHTEHVSDTPDVRFTRNRQAQDKKCVLGDRFSRIGHPRRMKETWDLSDQIPNTHLKREPGRASAPDR